jgi:aquaporin Z
MQMRKLIVEAIGTFFLVLTIGQVVIDPGAGAMGPLAIGGMLMVMVYAGGHISGAHYNPAVTLAVYIRGKATLNDMLGYWAAQFIGAALAGLVVNLFKADAMFTTAPLPLGPSLLGEFIFTFALAYVVLNVATAKGTEGNSYYGLAIGMTVSAGAFAVGPISGGVFNPAVAVGAFVMSLIRAADIWVFFVAPIGGAALAAIAFRALDLDNDKPTTATAEEQRGLRQAGATK